MSGPRDLQVEYRRLEEQMKALAETDGDVFLPSAAPKGPADYLLICMEPSLGRWARSAEEARTRVEAGFRNFLYSIEDFILHFAIEQYLCDPGQTYHVTDVSKGAMLVERARSGRKQRYDHWYDLLIQELRLVAKPTARFFAVGNAVADLLRKRGFPWSFTKVIHYSGVAARARAAGIVGYEGCFEEFKASISLDDLVGTGRRVLTSSGIPGRFQSEALARLMRSQLSESRKKLIFNYRVAFEAVRCSERNSVC